MHLCLECTHNPSDLTQILYVQRKKHNMLNEAHCHSHPDSSFCHFLLVVSLAWPVYLELLRTPGHFGSFRKCSGSNLSKSQVWSTRHSSLSGKYLPRRRAPIHFILNVRTFVCLSVYRSIYHPTYLSAFNVGLSLSSCIRPPCDGNFCLPMSIHLQTKSLCRSCSPEDLGGRAAPSQLSATNDQG